MSNPTRPTPGQSTDVDWDAPELRELLGKIEGLRLDNRGMFKPRPVHIRTFWPANTDIGPGQLTANDGNGHWTVVTRFPINPGTALTVEVATADSTVRVPYLCEVLQCRAGLRNEDLNADPPIWVIYLSVQRADHSTAAHIPSEPR